MSPLPEDDTPRVAASCAAEALDRLGRRSLGVGLTLGLVVLLCLPSTPLPRLSAWIACVAATEGFLAWRLAAWTSAARTPRTTREAVESFRRRFFLRGLAWGAVVPLCLGPTTPDVVRWGVLGLLVVETAGLASATTPLPELYPVAVGGLWVVAALPLVLAEGPLGESLAGVGLLCAVTFGHLARAGSPGFTEAARLRALNDHLVDRLVQEEQQARDAWQRVVEQNEELRQVRSQVAEVAARDDLSGLRNRSSFLEALELACTTATAPGARGWCLALVDVDQLRSINDRFGADAGDEALVEVAKALRSECRAYDELARVAGDEFAVLIRGADLHEAADIADRFREACSRVVVPSRPEVRLTVSVGVVHGQGRSVPALLQLADRTMWRAKERGGNRVAVATDSYLPTASLPS